TEQKASAADRAIYCNTLGTALFRAGAWQGALEGLSEAVKLHGFNAWDGFFLAMTHAKLGHKQEAQKHFQQAVAWVKANKPEDEEVLRFYAEAAGVLGVAKEGALLPGALSR